MSSAFFLYVLLFSTVALTADVKVAEITAKYFENYTTKPDGITVVMFYAPWCPHCVEIKPELFKAAAKIAEINSKNIFVLLNCEDTQNTGEMRFLFAKNWLIFIFSRTLPTAKRRRLPNY